jgi:hypothetical protein
MFGHVDPLLERVIEDLGEDASAVELQQTERLDLDGESQSLLTQDMFCEGTAKAIPRADDDDPEPVAGHQGRMLP